jgi:hypothetical protein
MCAHQSKLLLMNTIGPPAPTVFGTVTGTRVKLVPVRRTP